MVVLSIKVLKVHNIQDDEDWRSEMNNDDQDDEYVQSYMNNDDQNDLDVVRRNEVVKVCPIL